MLRTAKNNGIFVVLNNLKKDTLYFVCSGNTCRSPMAERLLRHALAVEKAPTNLLKTDSFGTSAFPGLPASDNSIFVLSKVGLNLDGHRSKTFDQINQDCALAYICMTEAHKDTLIAFHDVAPQHVFLFRQWVGEAPLEIPDPFGMGVDSYAHCLDSMVESIPSVLMFLKQLI